MTTFHRRQVVRHQRLIGRTFTPDWSESAVVVGSHPQGAIGKPTDEWYVVRFADGGMISCHLTHLMPSNDPDFQGRLPTYRQTQR